MISRQREGYVVEEGAGRVTGPQKQSVRAQLSKRVILLLNVHVRVCFSPRSARGDKVQTCARIMVRVHFHFESWVRGTRELPWSHLLPAARPGNVRPTILCSRPGYFHTGWVFCTRARTSMHRGVGKTYWQGCKVRTLTMVSLKKGSLLQASWPEQIHAETITT